VKEADGGPIITLTTDFGLQDHYVGVLKGVILGINPRAQLVDISHNVTSFSITEAAFSVAAAYPYFPRGTIHVVIVDPGVGSSRRPVAAHIKDQYFVAPDNGALSLVLEAEPQAEVVEAADRRYFLSEVGHTFHGRDVFAPLAAWLSRGIKLEDLGSHLLDPVKLKFPVPEFLPDGNLAGQIIHIDKFGNLISNIPAPILQEALNKSGKSNYQIYLGGRSITRIVEYYAQGKEGEPCVLFGSTGRLEIAANKAGADKILGIGLGTKFIVNFI